MRFIYSVLLYLLTPAIVIFFLSKLGYRAYFKQRFGFTRKLDADQPRIWLHAASVGEVLACVPLVKALQREYSDCEFVLTTTTTTGAERVRAAFGNGVRLRYAPLDLPCATNRFITRLKPGLAILMETELWPNTIAACVRHKVPVVVANGRMSEKSARGYARFGRLSGPMFESLSFVAAQTQQDAQRFVALGMARDKCQVTGSIKFDLSLSDLVREQAEDLRNQWSGNGRRMVLVAASTHRGEDESLLEALEFMDQSRPPLLVMVPRHPERFNGVVDLCLRRGYETARFSTDCVTENTQVLVVDAMGELLKVLGAADIAFVGGSLIENGGHNLIEPAAWGVPIITGPSLFNFAEIASLLTDSKALVVVNDSRTLAKQVNLWLGDKTELVAAGQAALAVAEANRGSLNKLLALLAQPIDALIACRRPPIG